MTVEAKTPAELPPGRQRMAATSVRKPSLALSATGSDRTGYRAGRVPTWLLGLVGLVSLVLFTIDLGTPSLWDPDEGLAAEIAREMRLTGKWLVPQLNFSRYAERPPAYFWLLASAMRLFGDRNEAAIRLPGVLLAVGCLAMVLFWGWRHLRPMAGTLATLVLATSAGYVAIGRLAIEDAAAGFVLSIALLGMSEPLLSRRTPFPWLFYVAIAGATLTIGPSALVLPVLVATFFVAWGRDPGRLLDLRPLHGIGLVTILVLPVLLLAAARDPDYVIGLFGDHSLIRFVEANFDDEQSYPLGAYVAMVPILMLPWGIFLPWSLRDALRSGGERSSDARRFLLAWLAGDVAFSMLCALNVIAHVILALVPLALVTGRALSRFVRRPRSESWFADPLLVAPAILFVAVLIAPFLTRRWLQNEYPIYADNIVFSFLLIPVAAAGIGAVVRRHRTGALAAITACGTITLASLYHFGAASLTAYNSMELPANLIADRLPANAVLVSFGTTSHTLAFYSGRPVRHVSNVGEARPLLNGDTPIALLTKERFLPEVRAEIERPLYVWWEGDSKKMLLANIPPPAHADRRILLPAPRT